jgi:hypothetical protein
VFLLPGNKCSFSGKLQDSLRLCSYCKGPDMPTCMTLLIECRRMPINRTELARPNPCCWGFSLHCSFIKFRLWPAGSCAVTFKMFSKIAPGALHEVQTTHAVVSACLQLNSVWWSSLSRWCCQLAQAHQRQTAAYFPDPLARSGMVRVHRSRPLTRPTAALTTCAQPSWACQIAQHCG